MNTTSRFHLPCGNNTVTDVILQLELANLRLEKENDELSAELRIALECFGYKMHLDSM